MKNKTLYFITCVVSVAFILPSLLCNNTITNVLSGIGCSGIAAGAMAIFLELAENKRARQRILKERQIYFYEIHSQLMMMIERLLWLNDRLEDDFNWELDPYEYFSLRYMVFSHDISQEKTISFQEAVEVLTDIGKKYNLENIKRLSNEQRAKVQKMFLIVASSSLYLLKEINAVENNKLLLDIEEFISIEEVKQLRFEISMAVEIMEKTDKNYETAIRCLLSATKKIREIGDYNDSVRVGLHGSIEMAEL